MTDPDTTSGGAQGLDPAPQGQSRLFLERPTYRLRRLSDAARMLPVLGVLLWATPMLWAASPEPTKISTALSYIFVVWAGLVIGALFLTRALRRSDIAASDAQAGRATDPGRAL